MLENYRLRFRKLFSMINIWRHYIISYFRIQEERYYEKLYKDRQKRHQRKETQSQAVIVQGEVNLTSTINLENTDIRLEPSNKTGPDDDLTKLNICFYIEEMFYYMLEVMHSTAAMAYTYSISYKCSILEGFPLLFIQSLSAIIGFQGHSGTNSLQRKWTCCECLASVSCYTANHC